MAPDLGGAFFDKAGFKHTQPYVGVSLDLEVFEPLSSGVVRAFGTP